MQIEYSKKFIKQFIKCSPKIKKILKDRTIKKVKKGGITLKALLIMAMKAYSEGGTNLFLMSRNNYDEIFSDKDIIKKSNELGALL